MSLALLSIEFEVRSIEIFDSQIVVERARVRG
jgi:hypothetical protein